jgi:hypothetical protein
MPGTGRDNLNLQGLGKYEKVSLLISKVPISHGSIVEAKILGCQWCTKE